MNQCPYRNLYQLKNSWKINSFLKLDKEYKSLLNKDSKKKTDGNLVVEIVPRDQDSKYVELPDKGDNVEVWGAWVIDKPKGWNEIHPAWKVIIN